MHATKYHLSFSFSTSSQQAALSNTIFAEIWFHSAFVLQSQCTLPETVTLPCATGTRQRPKNTRQTAHGIYSVSKQLFAECFLSRTRQMVCRVSNLTLGKKKVVCRVFFQNTLGKGLLFAECFGELHSANLFSKEFFFSAYFSLIAATMVSWENIQVSELTER